MHIGLRALDQASTHHPRASQRLAMAAPPRESLDQTTLSFLLAEPKPDGSPPDLPAQAPTGVQLMADYTLKLETDMLLQGGLLPNVLPEPERVFFWWNFLAWMDSVSHPEKIPLGVVLRRYGQHQYQFYNWHWGWSIAKSFEAACQDVEAALEIIWAQYEFANVPYQYIDPPAADSDADSNAKDTQMDSSQDNQEVGDIYIHIQERRACFLHRNQICIYYLSINLSTYACI